MKLEATEEGRDAGRRRAAAGRGRDGGAEADAALGNGHRLRVQGDDVDLGGKPAVTRQRERCVRCVVYILLD